MLLFSKDISKYTDEELLDEYRKTGKTDCFGQLYNRYIPLLYGVCLKYLQEGAEAEDAVMQIFEDLMPKVKNYEIRVFRTWIYSVAKNHCLQQLRKQDREITIDFDTSVMESEVILHLLDEGEDCEQWNVLQDCMEQLPEPQRISITGFFLEQLSYADIVEKTGYQLKSVKSYIQNGKRNLRICMEKKING